MRPGTSLLMHHFPVGPCRRKPAHILEISVREAFGFRELRPRIVVQASENVSIDATILGTTWCPKVLSEV